jgi:hypothetical protein
VPENLRGLLAFDPEKHARFKGASDYGYAWPAPVYPIEKSGGVTSFGMGGNGPDSTLTANGGNPVGDCAPNAAPKNVDQTTAALFDIDDTAFTSDQIVYLYFLFEAVQAGVSWRPPEVGAPWSPADLQMGQQLDVGVDLGDWLLWCFQQGLIEAFLKVAIDELDASLMVADAQVIGVDLNTQADNQFPGTWDIGPGDQPDPEDGHAVQRFGVESAAGLRKGATWGQVQQWTVLWENACFQQGFVVLTKEQAEAHGFPFDAVVADLKALGGTVVPTPAPEPAPPAPPAPTPSPPPKPSPEVLAWWREFVSWLEAL